MRSTLEKIALTVGLLSALIAVIGPILVTPQYLAVFENFHADIPPLTTFFIYYHHTLWLLPITVLIAWFKWPAPKNGALFSCLIGVIGLALVFSAGVYDMYLPVHNLDAGV